MRPQAVASALLRVGFVLSLIVFGGAPRLVAQDVGVHETDQPAWLRAWSPLLWTAELPRTLPSAGAALPDPVLWSSVRTGLFWTAGNPGALPFELNDEFSSFSSEVKAEDGSYRRPLDPVRQTETGVRVVGWSPFGETGAAIGRARVSRLGLYGALSDYDDPYPASPYVVMDTAGSDLARTEAALEGALGWRLGKFGFGVSLGYRAQQTRTEAAPVPRVLSVADPSAAVGAVFSPGWQNGAFRLGVHARWRAHAERVLLYSVAAPSRVYWLQGYFEARPQDIASGWYQRRLERDGTAFSFEAAGAVLGARWVAFVERGEQEERQHAPGSNDPDSDRWDSDAWTVGAAVRRTFPLRRVEVAWSGRYTALSGIATRGDLPDTVTFLGDESVFQYAADVSLEPIASLKVLGRLTGRFEHRIRTDKLVRIGSDISGWSAGFGMGAVYRSSAKFAVGGGVAVASYGAAGSIPNPVEFGVAYRTYVAPELAVQVSDALAFAANFSALWAVLPSGSLWLKAGYELLSENAGAIRLGDLPEGSRGGWTVGFGVVARE